MLDHFGDVSDVTGPNFAENTFNDPDNSADKPISLFVVLRTKKNNRGKKAHPEYTDCVG